MIANADTLIYISSIVGKPVLYIRNDVEEKDYYYLVDTFKPANPSNNIFDTSVTAKDLAGVLVSMGGFAHGQSNLSEQAILTKIDSLPMHKFDFNGFRWIKFSN